MRPNLRMAVNMEKGPAHLEATNCVPVVTAAREDRMIQATVTRLGPRGLRRMARRNNHDQCARRLDQSPQTLDDLRWDITTDAAILGIAPQGPQGRAGLDLVSKRNILTRSLKVL